MKLDQDLKNQLEQYLQLLESDIVLKVSVDSSAASNDMLGLVNEIADMSSKITVEETQLEIQASVSIA